MTSRSFQLPLKLLAASAALSVSTCLPSPAMAQSLNTPPAGSALGCVQLSLYKSWSKVGDNDAGIWLVDSKGNETRLQNFNGVATACNQAPGDYRFRVSLNDNEKLGKLRTNTENAFIVDPASVTTNPFTDKLTLPNTPGQTVSLEYVKGVAFEQTVQVTNETGEPLEAMVSAVDSVGAPVVTDLFDGNPRKVEGGRIVLSNFPDSTGRQVKLKVTMPGYEEQTVQITPGAPTVVSMKPIIGGVQFRTNMPFITLRSEDGTTYQATQGVKNAGANGVGTVTFTNLRSGKYVYTGADKDETIELDFTAPGQIVDGGLIERPISAENITVSGVIPKEEPKKIGNVPVTELKSAGKWAIAGLVTFVLVIMGMVFGYTHIGK